MGCVSGVWLRKLLLLQIETDHVSLDESDDTMVECERLALDAAAVYLGP
jgi:hypothetical protein